MTDPFASQEIIRRLTGRKRFAAQRRMLDRMGIPYLPAANGEPLVDHRRVVPDTAPSQGPRLDRL